MTPEYIAKKEKARKRASTYRNWEVYNDPPEHKTKDDDKDQKRNKIFP